jgi:hypothetical protein
MTAVNALLYSDLAVILSDGAGTDLSNGRLATVTSKMIIFPQMNAAAIVRGPLFVRPCLDGLVNALVNKFDDVPTGLPEKLKDAWQTVAPMLEAQHGPGAAEFELYIVGFDTNGARMFAIASTEKNAAHGLPAWRAVPFGICIAPDDDGVLMRTFGRDLQTAYSDEKAVALMDAQRALPRDRCDVGCFIQRTVVSLSGISTKIIHRWPEDQIGQRLLPIDLATSKFSQG